LSYPDYWLSGDWLTCRVINWVPCVPAATALMWYNLCSSRGGGEETWWNPVETPPSSVTKCGKYERKRGDSNDCTSRYCTGEPLRSEATEARVRAETRHRGAMCMEECTHGHLALQSYMPQSQPHPGRFPRPTRNEDRTKARPILVSSCTSTHLRRHIMSALHYHDHYKKNALAFRPKWLT